MSSPADILRSAFERVSSNLDTSIVTDPDIAHHIETVSRCVSNRACVRVLMACSLAKAHKPELDIRKPYTEIGTSDAYSGRTLYDQEYIQTFIVEHKLPCNPTTAFLTPAWRNIDKTLTPDLNMVGRPAAIYKDTLQLLTDVYDGKVTAEDVLAETIRQLILIRDEKIFRLNALIADLQSTSDVLALSSENIVTIIEQHLKSPNASRLPVLVVAAAYEAAKGYLGERALPLEAHNAADKQTHALGDIEITLAGDNKVVTAYEMKARKVVVNDIDIAFQKITRKIDNYIIITTELIDEDVKNYASSMYVRTGGIEFVVLDCIGFIRHFLHLFHRIRVQFLDEYQRLLLAEPESAVRQPLKESFLALRLVAETAYANSELEREAEE